MEYRIWNIGALALTLVLLGAGCLGGLFGNGSVPEDLGDGTPVVEEQVSASGNIIVTSPINGDAVTSPFTVTGRARVFENNVSWRILDENGSNVLLEGFTTADAPDVGEFGDFEARIFLPVIEGDTFFLEVLSYSAMDGAPQDQVRLELVPLDAGKTTVNVFFVDPAFIADGGDCSQVDFEKRTVHHTVNTAELALRELLEGPESTWAQTQIPEFTTLNSVTIESGVATVDFGGSSIARWNGGSCHVMALRAQIEETLLQFPSVSSVIINLDGSSDILEP